MLTVALSTLRWRGTTLVTTVLTLALGVALIAAAGVVIAGTATAPDRSPRRYAAAPVVVSPVDELRVVTANGVRTLPLAESRGLPVEMVDRVRRLGPVIVDRVFPVALIPTAGTGVSPGRGSTSGNTGEVGRPWPAAALGDYRLAAGRAPADDGEIVVPEGPENSMAVGAKVTVVTAGKARVYTVVGLTEPVGFERAVFFADAEAARLSPRVDALVPAAPAGSVRAVVGDDAHVLAGARRRVLDPDHRTDTEALVAAVSVVGTAAGVSGFVAVFVIASTFAYAVVSRRRELALLRTAGATPGQVRRSVVLEGLLLGAVGSAAGCVLGRPLARWVASWLVANELAPPWFTVANPRWPFVLAFAIGLTTGLLGVAAAAHRAGRIRPVEALRETAVETSPMTPGRWVFGVVTAGGALYLLVEPVAVAPAAALGRKHYLPATMLLLVAVALLAPLLVPPLAGGLGSLLGGATGLLARRAALTAARRTASMAAPVLLTAGLAGCVLAITATIDAAKATEAKQAVGGDYVVVPTTDVGLGADVVARIRAVPGVSSTNVVRPTAVYAADDDAAIVRHSAQAVDRVVGVPVLAGDPAALDERTIVLDSEFGWDVGDYVGVWLADGTPRAFRVVAVVRAGAGGNGAFLSSRFAGRAPASRVEVSGGPSDVVRRGLEEAVRGRGATVVAAGTTSPVSTSRRAQTLGLRAILGLALVLAVLSMAGTTLLAARDRRGESVLLRHAGATPAQVVRVACAEALLVSVVGLVLAASAVVVSVGTLWACLFRLTGRPMAVVVPWAPVAVVAGVCVGVSVLAALVPALGSVRRARRG